MSVFIRISAALALLLATAACSAPTDSAKAPGTTASDASATASTAPAAADERQPATASGNEGTIHLVVMGGPHAGTYDAVMHDGGASFGLAGEGQFGNQYSEDGKKPNELSSVQLVVNDVKGDKTTTTGFQTTISFGPLLTGEALNINTFPDASRPEGKGQLSLKYGGGKGPATVHFTGETKTHEKLDLTIEATKVTTAE
jgi:hypothetical protein